MKATTLNNNNKQKQKLLNVLCGAHLRSKIMKTIRTGEKENLRKFVWEMADGMRWYGMEIDCFAE